MGAVTELVMPKLGLTMTEGLLAEWRVGPGVPFAAGVVVAIVETDKIAHEVEATEAGEIETILVAEGSAAPVGAPIARLKGTNDRSSPPTVPVHLQAEEIKRPDSVLVATPAVDGARIVATPLARRLAVQNNVDLTVLTGSGPRGRIKAADVLANVAAPAPASVPTPIPADVTVPLSSSPPDTPRPSPLVPDTRGGQRRPAGRFELALARRLTRAKQEVPHFYLATEVDATPLRDWKARLSAIPEAPRITVTHLILAAMARYLRANPQDNRIWDDGEIVTFDRVDVGLAVDAPGGLMVPVLRDLGMMSIGAIADAAAVVVTRARGGTLAADDVGGGAVSLSNAGMHDVTYMLPIITPGHSAILGVGSVRQCFLPDAAGQPVLAARMGLGMSFDHRVFDGVGGLRMLNGIRALMEQPERLLI